MLLSLYGLGGNVQMMYGLESGGGGMMIMWVFSILVLVALCLSIAALWKYLKK